MLAVGFRSNHWTTASATMNPVFDCFYSMQKWSGKGLTWMMSEGGGITDQTNELEAFSCIVCPSSGVPKIFKAENLLLDLQNKEWTHKVHSFDRWHLSPSVYLGRHALTSFTKWTRLSISAFHTVDNQNVDGDEGLETRLCSSHMYETSVLCSGGFKSQWMGHVY